MITRSIAQKVPVTRTLPSIAGFIRLPTYHRYTTQIEVSPLRSPTSPSWKSFQVSSFHTTSRKNAQCLTADALMENMDDLYATAKDEFEIAAEETEKKTVYASDDRVAAREALTILQEAFEKAIKESDPEVSKEVRNRVGPRIRELENAVTAMEEKAMED